MTARIRALDALRLICALCVVQGHLRLGSLLFLRHLHGPRQLVSAIQLLFNDGIPIPTGPNAVIVFFVISGFCIHFPNRTAKSIDFRQFLIRRYLRVGIPALVAACFLYEVGFHSLQDSVLWSIACESIYYTLYPLLLVLRKRLGWPILLGAAYGAALLTILLASSGPYNGNFPAFGITLTWILGLPCWLLGCLLAETYTAFRPFHTPAQWLVRAGIVIAAGLCTHLRFHAGIGYYWSEPVLAILIYGWLGTEVAYFLRRRPWPVLEWAGGWSYSIYLFHAPIAIHVSRAVSQYLDISASLLVQVGAVLLGTYLMYLVVERPAHLLARRCVAAPGDRSARPQKVSPVARAG